MIVNVVLNLSSTSDVQVCVDADDYCNSISAAGNSNFIAPAVSAPVAAAIAAQVTVTRAASTTLKNAIAAPTSDVKNDQIRSSRSSLDSQITILSKLVENVANSPAVLDINREGIIHSAGMKIKAKTTRGKAEFKAVNTDEPSKIKVTRPGKANAYLTEYTDDVVTYANRVQAPPTTTSTTFISGLEIGKRYAIFSMSILPKGPNVWEGPIFITVT